MFGSKNKGPKLVFIIEDNTVYAKSLETALKSKFENLEVRIFPVGELGLDNLHLKPDCIILDYFLNAKYFDAENGLSILREIKVKDPRAKIIVLSAQQDAKVVREVKAAGGMYVIKNEKAFDDIAGLSKQMTNPNRVILQKRSSAK
jgi:two-component system response regulator FimZ (fimbrial Z protein)